MSDRGKSKYSEKNLSQCSFYHHHQHHKKRPEIERRLLQLPQTNHLSCGMAQYGAVNSTIFSPMAQQPLVGQDFLIFEALQSHSDTPHSVGVTSPTQKPLPDNT
jgi:hypothetical protein